MPAGILRGISGLVVHHVLPLGGAHGLAGVAHCCAATLCTDLGLPHRAGPEGVVLGQPATAAESLARPTISPPHPPPFLLPKTQCVCPHLAHPWFTPHVALLYSVSTSVWHCTAGRHVSECSLYMSRSIMMPRTQQAHCCHNLCASVSLRDSVQLYFANADQSGVLASIGAVPGQGYSLQYTTFVCRSGIQDCFPLLLLLCFRSCQAWPWQGAPPAEACLKHSTASLQVAGALHDCAGHLHYCYRCQAVLLLTKVCRRAGPMHLNGLPAPCVAAAGWRP